MKEYKRLGDYIREVNVRNQELKVNLSQGICNDKYFQNPKQVADNPETHKIVRTGQFAYNRATTRNGDKLSIALRQGPDCTVSAAYQVFEVSRPDLLLPEYLMMWFKRPEFDRLALFYSHGSAHEFFEWESMCDVQLPVPSIERQREIVSEYETLTRRIRLNEQMIEKLEATAQALYRHTFVDNVDKQNLPQGWRMGTFTEIARLSGGGTPDTNNGEYWGGDIPFFTPADSTKIYCIKTDKMLTELGFDNCSSKLYKKNTTFVTARGTVGEVSLAGCNMAMNQSCYALLPKNCDAPLFIHRFAINTVNKLKEEAVGAVFNALVTKDFETTEVIVPPINKMIEYNSNVESVYGMALIIQQENAKLTELQSLLLAKMGQ